MEKLKISQAQAIRSCLFSIEAAFPFLDLYFVTHARCGHISGVNNFP